MYYHDAKLEDISKTVRSRLGYGLSYSRFAFSGFARGTMSRKVWSSAWSAWSAVDAESMRESTNHLNRLKTEEVVQSSDAIKHWKGKGSRWDVLRWRGIELKHHVSTLLFLPALARLPAKSQTLFQISKMHTCTDHFSLVLLRCSNAIAEIFWIPCTVYVYGIMPYDHYVLTVSDMSNQTSASHSH